VFERLYYYLETRFIELGEGAFSIVYKVRRNIDNKEYALKRVNSIG